MAATGGSPASRERESFAAVRGILFAALFVALWAWVASWVRRFDPALGVRPPQWLGPAGWALAAAGGALAAWSVAAFAVRGHGTPAPFDPPVEFVAGGPYRFVRNPMYVGAIATLAGSGLVVRSTAILLLALAFWALAHVLVLAYEEPALERRFGESYRQYRRTVGRWLPRAAFVGFRPASPRRWPPARVGSSAFHRPELGRLRRTGSAREREATTMSSTPALEGLPRARAGTGGGRGCAAARR